MLTNTASAPLRRASVDPTQSRTMSVKSNTQLSRAGGVMEASLLRGSSVLLEPMPRRKEREKRDDAPSGAVKYTCDFLEVAFELRLVGMGASRTG